jgi:hypothetical protein
MTAMGIDEAVCCLKQTAISGGMGIVPPRPLFPSGSLEPKFDNDYAAGGIYCPELRFNLHPGGWFLHSSEERPACVARVRVVLVAVLSTVRTSH